MKFLSQLLLFFICFIYIKLAIVQIVSLTNYCNKLLLWMKLFQTVWFKQG